MVATYALEAYGETRGSSNLPSGTILIGEMI